MQIQNQLFFRIYLISEINTLYYQVLNLYELFLNYVNIIIHVIYFKLYLKFIFMLNSNLIFMLMYLLKVIT